MISLKLKTVGEFTRASIRMNDKEFDLELFTNDELWCLGEDFKEAAEKVEKKLKERFYVRL